MAQSFFVRHNCRLCKSTNIELGLSLAATPPANAFVQKHQLAEPQPTFPLDIYFCHDCAHVQLPVVVNPSILFRNYVYVSGTSPVFVRHFEDYAASLLRKFPIQNGALVVDIGSNDGTLLRFFKAKGCSVLGVDPARNIAATATQAGIETWPEFFNSRIAEKIRREKSGAAIITANNVLAHIDDLDEIVRGVKALLDDNGVFAFEVSYLGDVIRNNLFDTIYHEHLCYHSVKPLLPFFEKHEMRVLETAAVPSHGGSLRCLVGRKNCVHPTGPSVAAFVKKETAQGLHQFATLKHFGERIGRLKIELQSLLQKLRSQGKSIAGFGAPAKMTTLMYHFNIGADLVDFIVDDSPLKQGLYSPGSHIPVKPAAEIYSKQPDYLLLLAWNFADTIIKQHQQFTARGGRFIVPVPSVRIV